ncbi:hypothetical protein [Blastomonas sp. SL216]|uniref:hypothetical protein n=1 Tax=Blastomonas sp. SL216 TaxID=2995169 RepID=UPI002377A361|nr:hypothetical protein OU999_17650 [Blastomonas sp. SL216]
MPQTNLTKGNRALESLAGEAVALPNDLPFDLLLRPGNKTTRLVANSGVGDPIKSQSRWYDFEFSSFVFLNRLEISVKEFPNSSEFEIKFITVDGKEIFIKSTVLDGLVVRSINFAIKSVSFKPPSSWLVDRWLNSIRLIGFTNSDVDNFIGAVERIDSYRDVALSTAQAALENAQAENDRYIGLQSLIENSNHEIAKIKSDISTKKSESTRISEKINSLKLEKSNIENSIKSSRNNLSTIESEIETATSTRNTINSEIAEREAKLKSLKEDVNMFPSEISEFFGQGTRTMWLYAGLSFVPLSIIITMFALLVAGAADLTTVLKEMPKASIYSIFLTRIPYVVISGTIIAASYKLCRLLLSEVIKINQQKLNLTKISIIAKDVSFSAEHDLDIEDEEIYQLRTKLKMELLREHLKEYLSKDFNLSLTKFNRNDNADLDKSEASAKYQGNIDGDENFGGAIGNS